LIMLLDQMSGCTGTASLGIAWNRG
jgi:hypothetical protein